MSRARDGLAAAAWVSLLPLLVAGGCPRALDAQARGAAHEEAAPVGDLRVRPARTPIAVLLPDGQPTASLEPAAGGYTLVDRGGRPIGSVVVKADAVEVRGRGGEILCAAHTTTSGFRLDDGGDTVRLIGTEKSDGVVVTSEGEPVVRLADGELQTPVGVLRASRVGEYAEVSVDGERVLALRGFGHESAAWLAYTPLSFPERIAMMFLQAELL